MIHWFVFRAASAVKGSEADIENHRFSRLVVDLLPFTAGKGRYEQRTNPMSQTPLASFLDRVRFHSIITIASDR
jgi:hypothetical protein